MPSRVMAFEPVGEAKPKRARVRPRATRRLLPRATINRQTTVTLVSRAARCSYQNRKALNPCVHSRSPGSNGIRDRPSPVD